MQLVWDEMSADSGWNNTNKTRIQKSFSCIRSIFCSQRKTQHLRCSLTDAQGSIPLTPAVLGDLGRAVFAAEVELLSEVRTRQVFLGEDWKVFVSLDSLWKRVAVSACLRARFHRILRHMCNQKGRPLESCRDRHFQPPSCSRIQTVFHEISVAFLLFKPPK